MVFTNAVIYGFMNTSAKHLYSESESLVSNTDFIEIQVHDKLKTDQHPFRFFEIFDLFNGFFTIHGEGETDGKKKILFCSGNKSERVRYVKESASLYSSVKEFLHPHKVKRVVVHPDAITKNISREEQMRHLAESLVNLSDNLDDIEVCIEPRGADRQGKVLRADIEDIKLLELYLDSLGVKVGLCVDVAQLFVVRGNNGAIHLLEELKSIRLPVKEFHISDVSQTKKITNRVAMEVGKGQIDWQLILPLLLHHCNELLIETLGGIKVFLRSKSHLESLVKKHEVLL